MRRQRYLTDPKARLNYVRLFPLCLWIHGAHQLSPASMAGKADTDPLAVVIYIWASFMFWDFRGIYVESLVYDIIEFDVIGWIDMIAVLLVGTTCQFCAKD